MFIIEFTVTQDLSNTVKKSKVVMVRDTSDFIRKFGLVPVTVRNVY